MTNASEIASYAFGGSMIIVLCLIAVYFLGVGLFEAGKEIAAKINKEPKK